uniref:Uncharacterized protein n=1 Tax=Romanomermis culicivorax TaxID=13658 RepID=A0A915KZ08_ROMCU
MDFNRKVSLAERSRLPVQTASGQKNWTTIALIENLQNLDLDKLLDIETTPDYANKSIKRIDGQKLWISEQLVGDIKPT